MFSIFEETVRCNATLLPMGIEYTITVPSDGKITVCLNYYKRYRRFRSVSRHLVGEGALHK